MDGLARGEPIRLQVRYLHHRRRVRRVRHSSRRRIVTRLWTADEVAERLQLPKTWIYRAAREGDLPCVRCGRYRRFDPADVERWVDERKGSTHGNA